MTPTTPAEKGATSPTGEQAPAGGVAEPRLSSDIESGREPPSWSIGIYAGESPLRLRPWGEVHNPVLSAEHVSDVDASFLADPFMVWSGQLWYMFFEIMNSKRDCGEIGLATSSDCVTWQYQKVVLREPYHLSYPCVFQAQGEFWMIPETVESGAIRLYRAEPFPERWIFVSDLVPGRFADSTILHFQNKWWIFTCPNPHHHDVLSLYMADGLAGPWREHPQSPLIVGDRSKARPGGRVIVNGSKIIRYTQDCVPTYGSRVRAFEIFELGPTSYREREAEGSPVLAPDGPDWNACGMHHVDPHPNGGGWIACVDGLHRDWDND
jgi:hypothetical protein